MSGHAITAPSKTKRTPQQQLRDDRLSKMFRALERAANSDTPCPTNDALAETLGYASPSKASDLISLLEAMGFITVERGNDQRIVTIVKTGKRTAGHIVRRQRKGGWTEDQDAILMDGIAEGHTFAAVSKILHKSKNACIGRFRTLAANMGHQAS
ncbi:SANT/Myb domain-containing protein [Sphingobium naphthae]|nr:SANT/Myb domain-containing protein [Sphingobium naphthae]MEC7932399.1 SANT/Myb-like DNA-binding domain-containing protein [Pseudomonadota bacterium]